MGFFYALFLYKKLLKQLIKYKIKIIFYLINVFLIVYILKMSNVRFIILYKKCTFCVKSVNFWYYIFNSGV